MSESHALVFGASGLSGWAVVDQLLRNYPTKGSFSKVTACANRPLSPEKAQWPVSSSGPKLRVVSGLNLTKGTIKDFSDALAEKIQDMGTVTHVFYFAYKQEDDPMDETNVNRDMLEHALGALDALSPNLKSIVFPSGSRDYGVAIPGGYFTAPLKEDMILPPEHLAGNFHQALRETLAKAAKGKSWTWSEVRPDAIIGFDPNGSNFNLTAHWALYFSTYALIEGPGAAIPFPGSDAGHAALFNQASAAIIAKFSIWAALHPDKVGSGEVYNIADRAKPSRMSEIWPGLAEYFGLKGVGPSGEKDELKPGEYVQKHARVLGEHGVETRGRVFKAEHLDGVGHFLTYDRQFSMEKTRAAGFDEEVDPVESWYGAFDLMRAGGMIPKDV